MIKLAILNFYNAANATLSDADHMKNDVQDGEALKYFLRNEEAIVGQVHRLDQSLQKLRDAVAAAEKGKP